MTDTNMPDPFDRVLGLIDGLPGVDRARPSTVTTVQPIIGNVQTAVVQTYKTEDGFVVFLQVVSGAGFSVRVVIPAKVAAAIYRQRDALVKTGRKRRARDRWDSMSDRERDAAVMRLRKTKAG